MDALDARRMLEESRGDFRAAFALIMTCLASVGIVSLIQQNRYAVMSDSREIGRVAHEALTLAMDREAELRGTRFGDAVRPGSEDEGQRALGAKLDTLVLMTAGDAPQRARALVIRARVGEWEQVHETFAVVQGAPSPDGAHGEGDSPAASASFDRVRRALNDFLQSENATYRLETRRLVRVNRALFAGIPTELLVLGALVVRFRRRRRTHIELLVEQHSLISERNRQLSDQADLLTTQNKELQVQSEQLHEQAMEREEAASWLRVVNVQIKEARAAAEQLAEEQRSLLMALPETILVLDGDGRIIRAGNRNRLPGLAADVKGLAVSERLPFPAADSLMGAVRTTLRTGQPLECAFSIPDGQRTTRHYEAVVTRLHDAAHVLLVARDVTQRLKAEKLIAEMDRRLVALMDATSEVLWEYDFASRAVHWISSDNRAHRFMRHAAREGVRDVIDRIHPGDHDAFLRAVLGVVKDRERSVWVTEFRLRDSAGGYAWVRGRGVVIRDDRGRALSALGSLLDLSEHRSLEAQLQQAQKMEAVGQLAGGVAHDFNNLLTVISGYAAMELEGIDETSPQHESLREIANAAEHAAALTRQLLAFSRRQVRHPQRVAIRDAVLNSERLLRRLVPASINISFALTDGDSLVEVDPDQITQVIMNLGVNARDAMPRGGTLSIETTTAVVDDDSARQHAVPPGRYAVLTVSDTGIGMSPAVQERIFEPFFTTKGVGQGTGLGLATVHGIVAQSNGHVRVYSEAGHGATFRIYFPIVTGQPHLAPLRSPDRTGSTAVVLVVDDHAELRRVAERLLTRAGYTVHQAENGAHALSLIAAGLRPDIVLTDVVMPIMGARELVPELMRRFPHVGVILMSGYEGDSPEPPLPGVSFVEKPFTADALVHAIRGALARRASARAEIPRLTP
jgi:signal transduction histidine kinase/ActR/RegA family two-component response regulator